VAVLRQAAAGTPVRGIAAALYLSPNTVKSYLRLAAAKPGASGRAETLRRAAVAGLVPALPRRTARSALLDDVLRLAPAAGALPVAQGRTRGRAAPGRV
jgi:DNA-binding CsgD family transcriptional regulator